MVTRAICLAALVALAAGCMRSPRTEPVAPAPELGMPDITTLILPAADSATLASLGALLDTLRENSLFATIPEKRMYTLFRELEAAQANLNRMLSATDAEGRTLLDRLARTMANVDSLATLLDQLNRHAPRP